MSEDKKRILVVEDNMIAAKTAQFILEKLGCEFVDKEIEKNATLVGNETTLL